MKRTNKPYFASTGAASLSPPPKIFMADVIVTPQAASTTMTICSSFHSAMEVGFSQQFTLTSPWASARAGQQIREAASQSSNRRHAQAQKHARPPGGVQSPTSTGDRSQNTYRRHSVGPGRNSSLSRKYACPRSERGDSSCHVDELYMLTVLLTKHRSTGPAGRYFCCFVFFCRSRPEGDVAT